MQTALQACALRPRRRFPAERLYPRLAGFRKFKDLPTPCSPGLGAWEALGLKADPDLTLKCCPW